MTSTVMPQGRQRYFNNDGTLAAGCLLYTYAAGTLVNKQTTSDAAGLVPNTNPIVLDAKGEAVIYWDGAYKVDLKTAGGTQITGYPVDNLLTPALASDLAAGAGAGLMGFLYATGYAAGTLGKWLKDLALGTGAGFIGFAQTGVGATVRSLLTKTLEYVTAFDYGAKGDNATDDTAKIQALVTAVQNATDFVTYASNSPANGSVVANINSGMFVISDVVTVTKKIAFRGDGPAEFSSGSRLVQNSVNKDLFAISPIIQGMSVSYEDMTMRGSGAGSGDLIHIIKTGVLGACNSQRYRNLVFGTPSRYAMNIECGDDIVIDAPLFDVSSGSAVSLGTATPANVVTNTVIDKANFFQIPTNCILLYNVKNLTIKNARVYPSSAANRLACFADGYNTVPYQVRNVAIDGGTFENLNSLFFGQTIKYVSIHGVMCDNAGAGAGAARSFIELYGICSGFSLTDSTVAGSFDTKSIYDDTGATVTGANITGNTFINTGGGAGQALKCGNTSGTIANNTFVGFTTPSVSEQFYTSGNAIAPGVIGVGSSAVFNKTVTGAKQGDKVTLTPLGFTWPVPVGIDVFGYVSAANTVTVRYDNVTAGAIGVPAHDFGILVTR